MNKIAPCGLAEFSDDYVCGDAVEHPDAILVRSASLHDMDFDPATIAIARAGAGVNNIPIEACTERGICVFNTPGANANAVKELVVAGLFLSSRKIADGIAWCDGLKGKGAEVGKLVEKGKGAFGGPEIMGKTLGLIGLGAIGGPVANAAAALGMRVVGVDPYISEAARAQLNPGVTLLSGIDELLGQSDYISLHAPLTAETKGSVNAGFFAKAKPGVRLLNFSRADLVNSTDLLAALASGQCAAYVTDFPTDDIIGVPGVTAIPHLGASTPESEDNCAVMAARQAAAYLERGEIKNSVNLPAASLPENFTHRVCVIHTCSAEAFMATLGPARYSVTNQRGDVSYTVIDLESVPDVSAMQAIEGVLRARLISNV